MTRDEAIDLWKRVPPVDREDVIASCALTEANRLDTSEQTEEFGLPLAAQAIRDEWAAWSAARLVLQALHEEAQS